MSANPDATTPVRTTTRPSPSPRAETAYHYVKRELLEGGLAAGDRLSVVALAAALDCSRVPVMEALKRLESEGFVAIVPQVGCRVVEPAIGDVADFFTLFAAAEGAVTGLAAARRTAEDCTRFRAVCAAIDADLEHAGPPTARDPVYRQLNLRFHTEIHRMARSPRASRMTAAMWDLSDFYIKLAFGSLYFSTRVRAAHAVIRTAILAGDRVRAEAAVRDHLEAVGAGIVRHLQA